MRAILLLLALFQLQAPQNLRINDKNMSADFGHSGPGASIDYGVGGYNEANNVALWTCPNTGAQNVDYLKAICGSSNGGKGRIAIYVADTNAFVMQGSAAIVLAANSSEISHTSFVDQAGNPIATPQLTGGTNYRLVFSGESGKAINIAYDAGSANDSYQFSGDYTGGYPATLSPNGAGSRLYCIWCGVTPASSGLSIPVLLASHRRRHM